MDTVVVNCDGVIVQGETGAATYPRKGCHVVLAALPSVADQLLALRLTRLGLRPRTLTNDVSLAEVEELEQLINDICATVERRLVSWDWVDGNGRPLPSPPTHDVLLSLTIEELTQLATMRPTPNPKGLSRSTRRSTGRASRQKRGT